MIVTNNKEVGQVYLGAEQARYIYKGSDVVLDSIMSYQFNDDGTCDVDTWGADDTPSWITAQRYCYIPDNICKINNGNASVYQVGKVGTGDKQGLHLVGTAKKLWVGSNNTEDEGISILGEAFIGCYYLDTIIINNRVKSIGFNAFGNCGILTSETSIKLPFIGAEFNGTANTHFGYIFGAKTYTYNDTYVPKNIKTVLIGGEITTIGASAFRNCENIENIWLPNTIVTIGNLAFYGCRALSSMDIIGDIKTMGAQCFGYCTNLNKVSIGQNIASIGDDAFKGCKALKTVEILANTPPELGLDVFPETIEKILVPRSSLNKYKDAESWKPYVDKLVGE